MNTVIVATTSVSLVTNIRATSSATPVAVTMIIALTTASAIIDLTSFVMCRIGIANDVATIFVIAVNRVIIVIVVTTSGIRVVTTRCTNSVSTIDAAMVMITTTTIC